MKKITHSLILLMIFAQVNFLEAQITIEPGIFGQNAWYINVEDPLPMEMDGLWEDLKESGVTFCRIGGIEPNFFPLYSWNLTTKEINLNSHVEKLVHLINGMRAKGIEPIIQVGFDPTYPVPCSTATAPLSFLGGETDSDQAKIAGELVKYLNVTAPPVGKKIQNWIIANEPDLPVNCTPGVGFSRGLGYNNSSDALAIATYIRDFATQMKDKDPEITIIGPEMAEFGTDAGGGYQMNLLWNSLVSDPTSSTSIMGKIQSGAGFVYDKYYIDVLSFHYYPSLTSPDAVKDNPSDIVDGFRGKLQANDPGAIPPRKGLIQMITSAANNTGRSINDLKIACTEYNIEDGPSAHESTVLAGHDSRSFLAGQWLAEMFSVAMSTESGGVPWVKFMNFWSTKEGDCNVGKGYISNCTGDRRPSYYHFKMVASYFKKGKYYPSTSINQADVKAFACKTSNYIAVMILNQQQGASQDFGVHLDGTPSTSTGINITFNAGGASGSAYGYESSSYPIEKESSVLLIFDCNGKFAKRYDYKLSSPLTDPLSTIIETGSGIITSLVFTPAIISGSYITYPETYNLSGGTGYSISSASTSPYLTYTSNSFTVDPNTVSGPVTLTITVTGSNGCTETQDVTFYPNGLVIGLAPTGSIAFTPATCAGGYADGTASINSINCATGTSACSILWSTGSTAPSIYGLTPGKYSVTLTDYGTSSSAADDRSTTYNVFLNPDFIQQREVSTYTLWESYIKIGTTLRVKNGGTLDLRNNLFEFSPTAKIIVESGGILNITNATLQSLVSCPGTWAGIEVLSGGTLNLENSSIVKINGSGKIFIHDGGVLNYKQGASVVLQNNTSIIEIAGQLNIGTNANFTYTGNGYVKFSSPNPVSNISSGTGSSMTFERNNNTQKALEVTQSCLFAPANLSSFKINKCLVVLGSGTRIQPDGMNTQIVCTNAHVFSTGGNGLRLLGQQNVTINNCLFTGGYYGINALLTPGGFPLTISNCTFQNCVTGLKTHDKGVTINNVKFYECTNAGWLADAMSQPSVSNSGIFGTKAYPNGYGIFYHGGANGTLFLNNSKVNDNFSDGVYMSGTELKVKCGEIRENFGNGVYLSHNASLNMSNDLGGGNVDAFGNGINDGYYTIFMDNAKHLWLNNGFNDLARDVNTYSCTHINANCPMIIKGTMNMEFNPCDNTVCDPIYVSSNQNDWLEQGNIIPRPLEEYDINTSYNCVTGPRKILLTDAAPSSRVKCNDRAKPRRADILETCPTCPVINTPEFPNMKLNVAVKKTLDTMEVPGGGNRTAEELFYKILKHPYPNQNKETKVLLEIAYQNMLGALGQAYLKNELNSANDAVALSSNLTKMIEVVDDRILKYPCAEAYEQKLAASMDKAQTYRLADRRDLAIEVFDEILSWVAPVDHQYVQRWRCITNAEKLLKEALINPENFENAVAACGENVKKYIYSESSENTIPNSKNIKVLLKAVPNPANDKAMLTYILPEGSMEGEILIRNAYGQIVSKYNIDSKSNAIEINCSSFSNGIYFMSLIADDKIVVSEKLVIAK